MKLLTPPGNNPKLAKGHSKGYLTWALHLAPADLSGYEVCPMRTPGCTVACLNTAGRGRFDNVQRARIARTVYYMTDRKAFMRQLACELYAATRHAHKRGMNCAVRLNATSDIPWERVPAGWYDNIMECFPTTVQFYDYTKILKRMARNYKLPPNYDLTFSLAENNKVIAHKVLLHGGRIAVVFRDKATVQRALEGWAPLGSWPAGRPFPRVVDGDETDLRFLDPPGSIVALYAKGKARRDQSGFVQDMAPRWPAGVRQYVNRMAIVSTGGQDG